MRCCLGGLFWLADWGGGDAGEFADVTFRAGPKCRADFCVCLRKGQTKIQCLVAKEQGWRPEPGDEDFEVDAKECFVTGIAGRVDEFDAYGFNPVKHGVENSLINSTDDDDTVGKRMVARGHTFRTTLSLAD